MKRKVHIVFPPNGASLELSADDGDGHDPIAVKIAGGTISSLFPIVDPTSGDGEERGATQVDEEPLGLGELGVAPLPVT